VKGLDDGPDGLNDAAYERALRSSARRRVRPARVIRTETQAPTADLSFDAGVATEAWIAEMRGGRS
jgi:hypothetical protein